MNPMDLLKKALKAWGLELVRTDAFEMTYHLVKKDGGHTLRHILNAESIQNIQTTYGKEAAAEALKVILGGVFEELCAEPSTS